MTIHEVAMNRFPFPPEGEPPLGPIELLTYIVAMDTPAMQDDLSQGIKWTKAIQDFVRLWYVLSTIRTRFMTVADMNLHAQSRKGSTEEAVA